jgi:transposase
MDGSGLSRSEFSPGDCEERTEELGVHIIMDNYATHKHLRVRRWFAARPRFDIHFTPTYAS